MPAPNHYEVLGLGHTATASEIERRYAELWNLYGSDGAHAPMMKLIQEARRVLTSPALREVYDAGLGTIVEVAAPAPEPPIAPPVPEIPAVILQAQRAPVSAPLPEREITRPVPMPVLERTTLVTPPAPAPKAEEKPADNAPDERKLAHELQRRGVSPGEIERLIAAGRDDPAPKTKGGRKLDITPLIPPSEPYVPKPTITLPPSRQSTADERQRAERMLTNANIARRRGLFKEAERECREALDLVPGDAAALELYGDILQSVGRVDDALYTYGLAKNIDSTRKTTEKKYAELMLLQNREIDLLRDESIPRNAFLSVLLSAFLPGTGQIYNGDTLKGLVIAVIVGSCIYLLGWTPYGFHKGLKSISFQLAFFTIVAVLTYAYAVVDANVSARRGKIRSGWDV